MSKPTLPKKAPAVKLVPKTQKAKGIVALRQHGINRLSTAALGQARIYPHQAIPAFPFFARPCPLVPRHGFVDSRTVETSEQWEALLAEIQASGEKQVEVVCMPFLQAAWSGILTPSGVTFGPGHDGATSGHGARAVPAASSSKDRFLAAFTLNATAQAAGITDTPFIEFVATADSIEAVQLRNGPEVSLGSRYVLQPVTVAEVVEAGGDLLEWEGRMKLLSAKQSVVVWHPGGSLTSHYAVQAIVHGLPVICEDEAPKAGDTLQPSGNGATPLAKRDYAMLARLLAQAIQHDQPKLEDGEDIRFAVAALHAQALWGPERHLLVLRAVAVAYMMRFGAAAVLGELRHWYGSGPGRMGKKERRTQAPGLDAKCPSRDAVYRAAFRQKSQAIATFLGTAYEDYLTPGWAGSYGGKKWAGCTRATARLFLAAGAFLQQKDAATWGEVVSAWNALVHVCHNTGLFLNKFISQSEMGLLADVPALGLVSHRVGGLAMQADSYKPHGCAGWVGGLLRTTDRVYLDESGSAVEAVKKVADMLTAPIEARFQVRDGELYVQMKLPVQVNKTYGFASHFKTTPGMAAALDSVPLSATSLTGSGTPYAKGLVEAVDGVLVLTVGDLQVALANIDKVSQLFEQAVNA